MNRQKVGRAVLVGSILWTFGLVAVTLQELDWRGDIANNPIPDWLAAASLAVGSIMFLLGLRSLDESYGDRFGRVGRAGYWSAVAGIGISIVAIWPFIVIGPFVAGIGLTLYGFERIRLGGSASSGAWIHAACFPAAVTAGVLARVVGYDSGVGAITFIGFLILGFGAIGLRLMGADDDSEIAPVVLRTQDIS